MKRGWGDKRIRKVLRLFCKHKQDEEQNSTDIKEKRDRQLTKEPCYYYYRYYYHHPQVCKTPPIHRATIKFIQLSGKPPLKSTVYLVQYFTSTSASTTLSPGLKGLLAPFPGGSVVCVYVVRVYSESFHQYSVSSGGQGHRTE